MMTWPVFCADAVPNTCSAAGGVGGDSLGATHLPLPETRAPSTGDRPPRMVGLHSPEGQRH